MGCRALVPATLDSRAQEEQWDDGMREQARREAERYTDEVARLAAGSASLRLTNSVRRAFALANRAFDVTPSIRHTRWRPFQLGFVVTNLASIVDDVP